MHKAQLVPSTMQYEAQLTHPGNLRLSHSHKGGGLMTNMPAPLLRGTHPNSDK